mgnify:CR=1 FL=1
MEIDLYILIFIFMLKKQIRVLQNYRNIIFEKL